MKVQAFASCLFISILATGCAAGSSGDGDEDVDEPDVEVPEEDPPSSDLDLATVSFEEDNVSQTPTQMGFHGEHAVTSDGTRWVAWAEVDQDRISDMDIWVARLGIAGWEVEELTDVPDTQNTFPSMRAFGDTVYLVFNGRPDTDSDNDIFLTTNDGSGWTPQLDLTSEFEDSDLRRDYRPVLALTDQGVPVVAYLSTPITADGTAIGSTEIRLLVLGADGPVTVIEATPESMCGALDLAIDTDGAFHVVGGCGGIFTPKLVWATNANGSWTSSPLLLTETLRDFSPTLAAGPGGDVHLSWSGETVCPDRNCRKIFYAKRSASGFGDFTSLSADVEGRAIGPAVAVDANGRPLVAFHSNDGDDADLFLTWADANGNFATPRNITNSPTTNEQGITLTVDPMSGWPIMMFERVFSGTDPLNVDIFRVLPVIDVEPSY